MSARWKEGLGIRLASTHHFILSYFLSSTSFVCSSVCRARRGSLVERDNLESQDFRYAGAVRNVIVMWISYKCHVTACFPRVALEYLEVKAYQEWRYVLRFYL